MRDVFLALVTRDVSCNKMFPCCYCLPAVCLRRNMARNAKSDAFRAYLCRQVLKRAPKRLFAGPSRIRRQGFCDGVSGWWSSRRTTVRMVAVVILPSTNGLSALVHADIATGAATGRGVRQKRTPATKDVAGQEDECWLAHIGPGASSSCWMTWELPTMLAGYGRFGCIPDTLLAAMPG